MLFAVGHSFVEGTHHHKRALERLTNALFQTTSTKVYRRTATINIDGCRVSKNRDPPSLQHSLLFSESVSFEKWDCVIANTTNLLQSIGHHDTFILKRIGKLMHNGVKALKAVNDGLRGAGYHIFNLPKEMNSTMLFRVAKELCLPLIVSLSLNCEGTQCTHTIGVYPIRPIGGGPLQFRIVDGAHPDRKSITLSTENLDWCCGDSSFTTTAGGFALLPSSRRSQFVLRRLKLRCGTLDALYSSGISICLDSTLTINVPDHLREYNVVVGTQEKYTKIADQLLSYGKGQSYGKGEG